MKRILLDITRGTALALAAGILALVLASQVFGRLSALAALLPAAMAAMLLLAWLLHLARDGFFARRDAPAPPPRDPAPYLVPFGDEILEREGRPTATWSSLELMRALLWGALELGLVSLIL